MVDLKALWGVFPPKAEADRLTLYDLYRKVLTGDHQAAFGGASAHKPNSELSRVVNAGFLASQMKREHYVALNFCKTVATTFASKMFGGRVEYRIGKDEDPAQERFKQVIIDNTLDIINIEQAVASTALSGCVYRVRWGKAADWKEEMPVIEAIPAKNYFALAAPDNVKSVYAKVLAFPFDVARKRYVKVEIHEPYTITHELWLMKGQQFDKLVPFDSVRGYEKLVSAVSDGEEQLANCHLDGNRIIEDTGYPGMMVEYVPNFVLPDEYYGHSDYANLLSIQSDINESSTGVLRVILKHIDPKLIVPPGTLQYDTARKRWYVLKEDMETVELDEKVGAVLPRYVTWDAQLGAARANIDALFEAFMIIADVSLSLLGITKYSTAESGDAIELKMAQTTDAVQRKRRYFDTGLKNILYAAQWLDCHYGKNPSMPQEVSITWPSPVPMGASEATRLHAERKREGLESQRTAVRAVLGLDGEALRDEIEAMRSEHEQNDTDEQPT